MLKIISRILSSGKSLLVLSIILLIAFGGLFLADRTVKMHAGHLHMLTVNAERILNADRSATAAVRLAASMQSDRYVLNYQDFQDAKYSLLEEIVNLHQDKSVNEALAKMVDVQQEIEEAEAEAIAFIDEEKWPDALEQVTEPAFGRLKGIYRSYLSAALRAMIQAGQSQAARSNTIATVTQYGVLGMFLVLSLIGVLFSREMQGALGRQSELALHLEDANENLEQRVQDRTRELNESQALFKTVLDNMPAVVFLKDLQGRFQLINKRYEQIYDVRFDDVVDHALEDIYAAPLAQKLAAIDQIVIDTKEHYESEHVQEVNSENVTLSSVMFPIFDQNGAVSGFGGVEIDITDRKEAEKELASKEAQLHVAMDHMPGGMVLVDKNLNYVLFNSKYSDLHHFPDDLITVGGEFRDELLFQAARGDLGPGDRNALVEAVVDGYWTGEATSYKREIPDGPVLEFSVAPTPDGGRITIVTDVTEREQAQTALRESEERLSAVLEASPVGVSIFDSDDKRIYVNTRVAEMFGRTKEELIGIDSDQSYADLAARDELRARYIAEGRVDDFEAEFVRADGSTYWVLLTMMPVAYGGQQARLVWIYDITERRQAELEIARQKQLLEATMENMDQAIGMWDADYNLPLSRTRFPWTQNWLNRSVQGGPEHDR